MVGGRAPEGEAVGDGAESAGGPGAAVDAARPRPPRRSQSQRRHDMRARLAEATLDSLAANGYPGASLGDILARAGVSRGAWAHHFSSKKELVALAAEEMLTRAAAAAGSLSAEGPVGAAGDGMPAPEDRLAALLEAAWTRFYQGRHRDVLFEVAVACRTDAELRERLAPVFTRFLQALGAAWSVHLQLRPDIGGAMADGLVLTAYMMRGMALQEMVAGPQEAHAPLRRVWAGLLARLVTIDPAPAAPLADGPAPPLSGPPGPEGSR